MAGPTPLEPGGVYHVFTHANGGEDLFCEERNYAHFLDLYRRHVSPVAETQAFCLLRNHLHLLVHVRGAASEVQGSGRVPSTSQVFSNLLNAYAKAYNKAYSRSGALFERPFGRVRMADDDQIVQTIMYIHANPVRHGFAVAVDQWPHSSYRALLSGKDTWLQGDAVRALFGGREQFLRAHEEAAEAYRRAREAAT